MISIEVDCKKCPGLCCYSLKRPNNGRFLHTSNSGEKCAELTESCRCKIHTTIGEKSPGCAGYTCGGAGMLVTNVFQLNTNRICEDSVVQGIFILTQDMLRRLWRLEEYTRRYPEDVEENRIIQKFVDESLERLKSFNKDTPLLSWAELHNHVEGKAWLFLE